MPTSAFPAWRRVPDELLMAGAADDLPRLLQFWGDLRAAMPGTQLDFRHPLSMATVFTSRCLEAIADERMTPEQRVATLERTSQNWSGQTVLLA